MKFDTNTQYSSEQTADYLDNVVINEWKAIIDVTPASVIKLVFELFNGRIHELLRNYKNYLVAEPALSKLLHTEEMRSQWILVFEEWVRQLFNMQFVDVQHFVREQSELGKKLSRIGYPPHAVSKSLRMINSWILLNILSEDWSKQEKIQAVTYVNNLIGLSSEIRNHGYMKSISDQTRLDESYRFSVIGNNVAMERERQRAFLTEWERNVLAWFYNPSELGLQRLSQSEFGMWFIHKASLMFEGAPKLKSISDSMTKIDLQILPNLEMTPYDDRAAIGTQFNLIQNDLVKIKFVMNEIFDSHIELDNARDSLTRLLNRRFMHTVLSREIVLQKRVGSVGFAVLIIDLDHFKKVNDTYGHTAGDVALQKIAALITDSVKPSDFVFRYGGEEILLTLVEVNREMVTQVAESLRARIEQAQIQIPSGEHITLTASIGGALAKGKFDYESVVAQADQALYQAKNSGRNRFILHSDKE